MRRDQRIVFELLQKYHDRSLFDCGIPPLNNYLAMRAGQELRRNLAFPYMMTFNDDHQVQGYYTLSATSVALTHLPPQLSKQTQYACVPAVLIGRLALDLHCQGQGHGKLLLMDALRRISNSRDFAVMLVIVDPKDHAASTFYAHFGFMNLEQDQGRMFLPYKTIEKL